jgi:hypothetical protein
MPEYEGYYGSSGRTYSICEWTGTITFSAAPNSQENMQLASAIKFMLEDKYKDKIFTVQVEDR